MKFKTEQEKKEARTKVLIDAIAMLRTEQLVASIGAYVHGENSFEQRDIEWVNDTQAQEVFEKLKKPCHVCAIGACLVSYIKGYNEFTMGQVWTGYADNFYNKVGEIIPLHTLARMETAFERTILSYAEEIASEHEGEMDVLYQCRDLYRYIADPTERLLAILENVLHNDGEFDPSPINV